MLSMVLGIEDIQEIIMEFEKTDAINKGSQNRGEQAESGEKEYAGFWVRVGAALIDTFLVLLVTLPLLTAIYGSDYWSNDSLSMGVWDTLLSYVLPAIAVIAFWVYRSATPGKSWLHLTIVDAKTGEKPGTRQFVLRYLGYYVSIIPLFLGIIAVGVDRRKRGFHDRIAGTVVIRDKVTLPVKFEAASPEKSFT